jgi:hypothetical protein
MEESLAPAAAMSTATLDQSSAVVWGTGDKAYIETKGYGIAPEGMENTARGKLLARRAAIVDAQRNLKEMINGINISAETTMHNASIENDTVTTKIEGFVKGAEIADENESIDGIYGVMLRLPLYGKNGLSAIAMPALGEQRKTKFAKPSYIGSAEDLAVYTGAVIDASGLGLEAAFSPLIVDENGRKIYGYENIDADYAVENGMAGYANSMDETTGNSRIGENPLKIKAVRVDDRCNVVISADDADKLLAMNQQYGFLDKCAVVFVK